MARPGLLVDSGGLVAISNSRDHFHRPALAFLSEFFGDLITTWPAVTEACHIVPAHLNTSLVLRLCHSRWPMDLADASMVWASEQTGVDQILTVDRADFLAYRTKAGKRLQVLP
ncbi:MAG: hypothetical protein A3H35_19740 [Betaproteobacteria bacterium RIFCSPLOWO2_02_FULL_62_17]|nr:MAG: hypothetical protein A3H35_19740 [Betaproteobacteria bacterium RIFCSPLOWO2_02_FULL_62_17]